jgi:hypothetical protein
MHFTFSKKKKSKSEKNIKSLTNYGAPNDFEFLKAQDLGIHSFIKSSMSMIPIFSGFKSNKVTNTTFSQQY